MVEHTAFVAGATGYTGRAVVAQLREAGHRVFAHVRPGSSSSDEWGPRFEAQGATVSTVPWDAAALRLALQAAAPSIVLSLLGTTRRRAKAEGRDAEAAYEAVDYGLTAMLYNACAESCSKARFVYLSSAGVNETTANPYLKARARVEAELRAGAVPYTIARPSFITGSDREESRPGERAGAAVGDGVLGVLGVFGARRLRDRYASMDAATLAAALVSAATDPACAGAVLHGEDLRDRARQESASPR